MEVAAAQIAAVVVEVAAEEVVAGPLEWEDSEVSEWAQDLLVLVDPGMGPECVLLLLLGVAVGTAK